MGAITIGSTISLSNHGGVVIAHIGIGKGDDLGMYRGKGRVMMRDTIEAASKFI